MDMIYSQAYFTICATSSSSSLISFLQRPPQPKLRLGLRPSPSNSIESSYLIMPFYTPWLRSEWSAAFQSNWNKSNWNTRAWTFQERTLSERLVIFGTYITHFECSGFYSNETGFTNKCCLKDRYTRNIKLSSRLSQPISDEVRARVFKEFRRTLSSFATADLTSHRDRLPALAGIARRVNELTGSKYHAGCWEDDFHHDLVFHLGKPPPSTAANPRHSDSEQ